MNREQKLVDLVKSEGWAEAKQMLIERMMDIQSVMNVEGKNEKEVFEDIKLRKNLISEMKDWIADIEGTVSQYEGNKAPVIEEEPDHIVRS